MDPKELALRLWGDRYFNPGAWLAGWLAGWLAERPWLRLRRWL
jgi:hypothetical protein